MNAGSQFGSGKDDSDVTTEPQRPNVLLIMVDQLTAFGLRAYGNDEVITPHLDALAHRGVVFEHAYTNSPLCVPSRAAMMTGRLPSAVPCNDNAEEFPASVPTFAHTLRRSGYRTVLAGKMHFVGPDQLHGFEERLTTDIFPADLTWTRPWDSLGDPPRLSGRQRSGGREYVDILNRSGPLPWTYQMHYDEEVRFRTLQRLREFAVDSGPRRDQPWLTVASFTQPHDPYAATAEYWDRYEGRAISAPQAPLSRATHTLDEWVNAFHGVDQHNVSHEQTVRARRGYYAMISYIDDVVGELLSELDRLGMADNTVVIFTSDHGDQLGEHGMYFKRTLREWSVRVPLIVAGLGVHGGQRVTEPVSLVDLHPTLAELAEAVLPESVSRHFAGASIVGHLRGEPTSAHPDVIVENYAEGTITPVRALVRGRHKLIQAAGLPDQFFDLHSDPAESTNLIDDPAYAADTAELRKVMALSWDPDETKGAVLESQRIRAFLGEAMEQGRHHPWDHVPDRDASRQWIRSADDDPWDPLAGF